MNKKVPLATAAKTWWLLGAPDSPHSVANKTAPSMEEQVLTLRTQLAQSSNLGEYGAQAICRELLLRGEPTDTDGASAVPSVPTINRILARHGVFDARKRVRRPRRGGTCPRWTRANGNWTSSTRC